MKLILPNKNYKNSYYDLVESSKRNGDSNELGNALIREEENYDDFLLRIKNRRKGKLLSKRDVPATIYFIIENDEVIGTIDLRHLLNKDYFERLGHVAYYIKPELRNRGYATNALRLAKKKYYNKHINKILITCYNDNEASKKVILKNDGVFEKDIYDEKTGKTISRYYITIRNDNIIVPKTVWLTTNRTCNNKCNWCYASNCKDKLMNYNDIKEYVNELYKIGVTKIILIGGEPTIFDDIVKTIKYISDKGISVSMASNGRLFSDYSFAKKLVDAGLKNCNISIKGSDEVEYLQNTNSTGFLEMIQGYNNLKKLGINVSTSYVLCNTDFKVFDKFWQSFINNKLDNISFQLYKPSVDGETYNDAPTINDIARLCEYVFYKIRDTNIKYSFEMSIPLCSLKEEVLEDMINRKCITTCCHITKGSGLIFDSSFNIMPCNHFVNHPFNKEKIAPKEILEYWNNGDPKSFRKVVKTYPHKYCKDCELWEKCGGGCFLRWLSSRPDLFIRDIYRKEV